MGAGPFPLDSLLEYFWGEALEFLVTKFRFMIAERVFYQYTFFLGGGFLLIVYVCRSQEC